MPASNMVGTSENFGRSNEGKSRGISPRLLHEDDRARREDPGNKRHEREGDQEIEIGKSPARQRNQCHQTAQAKRGRPHIHLIEIGKEPPRFLELVSPEIVAVARQIPELPQDHQRRDAGEEADHDRVGHELGQHAKPEQAKRDLNKTGDQGDGDQGLDPIGSRPRPSPSTATSVIALVVLNIMSWVEIVRDAIGVPTITV